MSTIADFWSLVYDHEGSAIVVLCNPEVSSVRSMPHPPSLNKKVKFLQLLAFFFPLASWLWMDELLLPPLLGF
jgi:hypothetical protein